MAAAVLRGPRSVRWRLTLLYSALFAVAGAVLLSFTYVLVANSEPAVRAGSPEPRDTVTEGLPEGLPEGPGAPFVAQYA